jgi:antitoxin (DNA-binding transcriptional repressor) of toxin-antitoxin stability system
MIFYPFVFFVSPLCPLCWEGGETVAITRHGRVIAHLVPVRPSSVSPTDLSALWADLDALAAETGARTPEEDR